MVESVVELEIMLSQTLVLVVGAEVGLGLVVLVLTVLLS
jgi:hypothetical protein